MIAIFLLVLFVLVRYFMGNSVNEGDAVVNLYTARKEEFLQDILKNFTEETGIKVNVTHDAAGKLLVRMKNELDSPSGADVFLAADSMSLFMAKHENLLSALDKKLFTNITSSALYDRDHFWIPLTKRARVIVYAKDRVDGRSINSYEDLARPEWQGKVLVSSSASPYNQALLAYMHYHLGYTGALNWAKGFVKNFARKPYGGDTEQIRAVLAGEGDVAVSNSYYVARMIQADSTLSDKIGVIFPGQYAYGTHVNVSGAGILKNAANYKNALMFIDFMLHNDIQSIYARKNNEYPVIYGAENSAVLESWGTFKEDTMYIGELTDYAKNAAVISDRAGWY